MRTRNEEEYCRSIFQSFLEERGFQEMQWERVDQQFEPPDYYLLLNGKRFAVEVTTLMEQVGIGGQKLSMHSVLNSLRALVEKVKAEAIKDNFLQGAYVVRFARPIEWLKDHSDQIHKDLLEYIKATQFEASYPEQFVYKRGRQIVAIQKIHNQKTYIGRVGPTVGKREGEIIEEIAALIEERIRAKQEKLKGVLHPLILLLYDAYLFADAEMYQACLDRIPDLSTFHTVFLVPNDMPGIVLYSENSDWCVNSGS